MTDGQKNTAKMTTRVFSGGVGLYAAWAMAYVGLDPLYGTVLIGLSLVAIGAIELDSAGPIDFGDSEGDCGE